MPVGRCRGVHVRAAGHHEQAARHGDVSEAFVGCFGQVHGRPALPSVVDKELVLARGVEPMVGRLGQSAHVSRVGPGGKPAVHVAERRGAAVGLPHAAAAIHQHATLPAQRAAQQSLVPLPVGVAAGQQRAAHVDARKEHGMVEHDARQAEHQEKKRHDQPQPAVVFLPCAPLHGLSFSVMSRSSASALFSWASMISRSPGPLSLMPQRCRMPWMMTRLSSSA